MAQSRLDWFILPSNVLYRRIGYSFVFWLAILAVAAQGDVDKSYSASQVKAVMFHKILIFVEWPELNSQEPENPLVIGVSENSKLYPHLVEIYKSYKVRDRKVVVRVLDDFSDCENCHVLLIESDLRKFVPEVIQAVGDRQILTIGDGRGFAERGLVLNFFRARGKISFEVNMPAVKQSGLRISSKLLKKAKIIYQ